VEPVSLFDANAIVGPLALRQPGAPEDVPSLLATMADYGLGRALVTHTVAKWHYPPAGNDRLMREIVGHDQLAACWVVLPAATCEVPPETEQVTRLLAAGVRAARLCPTAHRLRLDSWVVDPLLGALAEHRIPMLLDFDTRHWSENLPWDDIERAARSFPSLPIVLVRLGHADVRSLFPLLDRCPNLYVETSYYQGHDGIRLLVERWGADRLIFGTGLPIWDPGLPITGLTYAGLAADDLRAVAGGTLDRLLGGVTG
jgi:predicted TIM-barrel fold metal-dependent hydrolase